MASEEKMISNLFLDILLEFFMQNYFKTPKKANKIIHNKLISNATKYTVYLTGIRTI